VTLRSSTPLTRRLFTQPTSPGRTGGSVRASLLIVLLLLALAISGALNALLLPKALQHDRLVAASWDPGIVAVDTPGLYGAYVWLDGDDAGAAVMLTVFIDRPSLWAHQQHEDRRLGTARTAEEAVQRWGTLRWSEQGLQVGTGADAVLFSAADLRRHR
jgi:hypothetical protein